MDVRREGLKTHVRGRQHASPEVYHVMNIPKPHPALL